NSTHRRGTTGESCFDSQSPARGTCVRLQASNSIAGPSLIRCSGRQHYERLDDWFDPLFEQKRPCEVRPHYSGLTIWPFTGEKFARVSVFPSLLTTTFCKAQRMPSQSCNTG